jgi:uncharacterized protein YyaL (SSP411 family)
MSHKNRLAKETSPYLLQHAENPVDWYPWGPEALEKARSENKVILVSIGYSACHWCHVMEHESFENQQVADVMNQYFVNIKVDREERPDVDAIYMDSLQAMGVRGGWPLNVFLMPDAKPFYGGTYFPRNNWVNLLHSIQSAFNEQRDKLQESADGFALNLQEKESAKYRLNLSPATSEMGFTDDELRILLNTISKDFDTKDGGMRRSPKFPMPAIWNFLTGMGDLTGSEPLLAHLKLTLDRIALGGIYDHLGGGWTRYSTDEIWKVPHFEKMLYDNGQLMTVYAGAAGLFRELDIYPESVSLYQWAIRKTIAWLEREMTNQEGGFYSAQDADSEGEEGKYYVWKASELRTVLGEDYDTFAAIYEITGEGNWEHGNNILHLEQLLSAADWNKLEKTHDLLFEIRDKRIKPGLDNKILCSWNGLMLNGLIDAYRMSGDESIKTPILKNAEFIRENLLIRVFDEDGKEGRGLWHMHSLKNADGNGIHGFLEDYGSVILAFVNLYQLTFDESWLREAEMLADYTLANFFDAEEGLFYFTDIQGEELIARKKELFDNVIPGSNSIMAHGFLKLSVLAGRTDFRELSESMFFKLKNLILADPQWLSNWAALGLSFTMPMPEIVLAGPDIHRFRKELDLKYYDYNKVFAGTQTESKLPLLEGRNSKSETTMIYVCFENTCQLPVSEVDKAVEILKRV